MGRPLRSKEEIIEYSGLGRKRLAVAIERAEFPHFYIARRMMSHTDAVDDWFIEVAVEARGIRIDEGDGNTSSRPERKRRN